MKALTHSSTRRALLMSLAGCAALCGPLQAEAPKLPDYHAAAGMLKIGPDHESPDAEIFHIA